MIVKVLHSFGRGPVILFPPRLLNPMGHIVKEHETREVELLAYIRSLSLVRVVRLKTVALSFDAKN